MFFFFCFILYPTFSFFFLIRFIASVVLVLFCILSQRSFHDIPHLHGRGSFLFPFVLLDGFPSLFSFSLSFSLIPVPSRCCLTFSQTKSIQAKQNKKKKTVFLCILAIPLSFSLFLSLPLSIIIFFPRFGQLFVSFFSEMSHLHITYLFPLVLLSLFSSIVLADCFMFNNQLTLCFVSSRFIIIIHSFIHTPIPSQSNQV